MLQSSLYVSVEMAEGSSDKMLVQFGTNLTELAQQGKLDPVIGREAEVRRTLQMYHAPLAGRTHWLLVWRAGRRTIRC